MTRSDCDNVASPLDSNRLVTATFPPAARLRNPQQFQQTFSQGRRIGAALFRLHVRFSTPVQPDGTACSDPVHENTASARLGIAVSKRVEAHAVGRNRIKRVVRECFRAARGRLPAGDYVLLAQREAATANNTQLAQAVDALWVRAIALGVAEAGAMQTGDAALKRGPATITMPARDMLAADPGRPPESP